MKKSLKNNTYNNMPDRASMANVLQTVLSNVNCQGSFQLCVRFVKILEKRNTTKQNK
jgi:hypothetical protein